WKKCGIQNQTCAPGAKPSRHRSHVSACSQALEGVLSLLVLSARTPLSDVRVSEFFDDFRHAAGIRSDWPRAWSAAQTPVAHSIPGEIQIHDRYPLTIDVLPHVHLSPM